MEGEATIFAILSGTGIVECLEITDVNLKQFDGLTWQIYATAFRFRILLFLVSK